MNKQIVYCPNCGSCSLNGAAKSNPFFDFSLSGYWRRLTAPFRRGIIGAVSDSIQETVSQFQIHKVWQCCECGYEFNME